MDRALTTITFGSTLVERELVPWVLATLFINLEHLTVTSAGSLLESQDLYPRVVCSQASFVGVCVRGCSMWSSPYR